MGSLKETAQVAQVIYPELGIKLPVKVPKLLLYTFAWFMEFGSKFTGKAPLLQVKDIAMFSGLQQNYDITKARRELGFEPTSSLDAVKAAMAYLMENKHLTK